MNSYAVSKMSVAICKIFLKIALEEGTQLSASKTDRQAAIE